MKDLLSPCWVRIAALQKQGRTIVVDSQVLSQPHARHLFSVLKENGSGMHCELWSQTFQRILDEFTHKNYPHAP